MLYRSCFTPYGSLDRQPSRDQLKRQPSNLTRQVSSKNVTSGCHLHDEKLTASSKRETYQHNKQNWKTSLRGSSAKSRKQTVEKDIGGRQSSVVMGTHSSRAKHREAGNRTGLTTDRSCNSISPRRRSGMYHDMLKFYDQLFLGLGASPPPKG